MEKIYRKELIDTFIDFATTDENRAELFKTKGDSATTKLLNGYKIILRSNQIENLFERVVRSVKANEQSQGFLYFLHQADIKGNIYPLYLGIARKKGKKII